jgi:parvulin-like peptidyl-prolyl isomerase
VIKRFPLLVLLLVSGVACQKGPAQNAPAPAAKPAAAPAAAPGTPGATAVKPVPDQLPGTIAKVNGEAISKDEFERAVRNVEGRAGQPVPAERRSEVYRGVLDQMIAFKLLLQSARTQKVAVTDPDVDARVKAIQSGFPDEQTFAKALAEQKVSVQQLREDQRQQLVVSKVLETEVGSKVQITPEQVADFYTKNQERFKEPENVQVQHILLTVPQGADAATKAKAKAEADGLLKQVRGGTDFAKLAREKSQDSGSATNGGNLPPFARGQGMVQPFEDAAFKLTNPGQVSPAVETPFGFHIIKMVKRNAPRVVPLDEARPQIAQFLREQESNLKSSAFIESLKTKSRIEIYI